MARRANSKTIILDASHVAMLSKPKEVLEVILDAAKSIKGSQERDGVLTNN
jgi:hypothetical protein